MLNRGQLKRWPFLLPSKASELTSSRYWQRHTGPVILYHKTLKAPYSFTALNVSFSTANPKFYCMPYLFTNRLTGDGFLMAQTILFVVLAVLAANLGLSVFNRLRKTPAADETNSVTGIFFGAVSVLYSLILAFVIVAEWDEYNNLNATVAAESDKLNSILSHSSNLPDNLKSTISTSLSAYCEQVLTQEWTQHQSRGTDHPSAIPVLRHLLLITEPANSLQTAVLKVIDDDLSAISDLRRSRLSHTRSQLPQQVWMVLGAGAVLLVVFCFFFSAPSVMVQRLYVSFFVCILTMCLAIVYNLDHPFAQGSGIDNSPYKKVLAELPAYYTAQKN